MKTAVRFGVPALAALLVVAGLYYRLVQSASVRVDAVSSPEVRTGKWGNGPMGGPPEGPGAAAPRMHRPDKILFVSLGPGAMNRSGLAWDIFVVNPDGSGRRNLTRNKRMEIDPAWSPDGTRIVFAALEHPREQRTDLWVMKAEGSQARRLTGHPESVFLMNGDGTHPRLVKRVQADWQVGLQWLPRSRRLVFTRIREQLWGLPQDATLYALDPATGREKPLIKEDDGGVAGGGWFGTYLVGMVSYIVAEQRPVDQALIRAVQIGDGKKVKTLLEKGADPDARWEFFGLQALTIAAGRSQKPSPGLVRLLLDAGANVNARAPFSSHPLEGAATLEIARLLIERGADQEARNDALIGVAEGGSPEWVRFFLAHGAHADARRPDGESALMRAALWGHLNVVTLLLDRGADVNARSEEGWTPLTRAALQGHLPTARVLIGRGADVNARLKDGETALILAAEDGGADLVRLLLDRSADLHAKTASGHTALMRAARGGNLAVIHLLLDRGADVNARRIDGRTPLMLAAAEHGGSQTVRLLLARGADPSLKDNQGRTALQIAQSDGHHSIARLLTGKRPAR
jgi:ankyrin repeat protein